MLPIQNSNKLYTIPPPYLRNLIHKEFLVRVFSYALNIFNFMLKDLSSNQLHLTLGGCIYIGSRLYNNDDNDLELLAGSNHTPDDLKQKVIEINQVLKHNVIISHPYVFARAQVQIHGDLHLIPLVDQLMLIFLCSSVSQTYSPEVLGLNVYELARTFKSKSPRTPLQFKMIVELWSDVIASERSSYSLSQFYRDLGIFSIYTDLIA